MLIQVGPLVIPRETACLECLRLRQNSNMDNYSERRAIERAYASCDQSPAIHPAMASIAADVAAMEIAKFFGKLPFKAAGILHEINLLKGNWQARRVLKMPRCPICGDLNRVATIAIAKDLLMPGNQQ